MTTPNAHSLAARSRYRVTGRLPEFGDRGEPTHVTPVFLEPLRRVFEREALVIDRAWTLPERTAGGVWRPAVRLAAGLARSVIQDPLPGITSCVLARKNVAGGTSGAQRA